MRVLQFISSRGFYGAESMVLSLTGELHRGGAETALIVFRNGPGDLELVNKARSHGLNVELVECGGRWDWKALLHIRRYIRDFGAEIVHAHGYKANFYTQLACRGLSIVSVMTQHTDAAFSPPDLMLRLYYGLNRFLLRQSCRVVAVSESVAQSLGKIGLHTSRIQIIHNGIDTNRFTGSGAAPAGKRIAVIGRLIKSKGHEIFLQAAKRVAPSCPEARFLIIGEGPERAALERLANELGIARIVSFYGHVADMPSLYPLLDVVALPSFLEGLPMTILEALAAAKPVVATDVGGMPSVIRDNQTGLLVPPGDVGALSAAFNRLLVDPALCRRLGQAGAELVRNRYSAAKMANEYFTLYEEALFRGPDAYVPAEG